MASRWMASMIVTSNEITPRSLSDISLSRMERGEERVKSISAEEAFKNYPTYTRKVLAELLATFVFIFIGCGADIANRNGNLTPVGVALTWGSALTAMIYTVGHISGAHFNPAVTIAYAVTRKFPWKQVPLYLLVQLVSATVASSILRWLHNGEHAELMLTLPAATISDRTALVWEIVASAILIWVKTGVATDDRAVKQLHGVAIGGAFFGDIVLVKEFTGASFNPARSLGPAIATHNFHKIWIYIVAPVTGMIIGAALYDILRQPDKSEKKIELRTMEQNRE